MSAVSYALLFLLCLSLHACNGRHLSVTNNDHGKYLQHSNKRDEKDQKISVEDVKAKPSLSNKFEMVDDKGKEAAARVHDHQEDNIIHKQIDSSKANIVKKEEMMIKGQRVRINSIKGKGGVGVHHKPEHLDSVSWRVPRNKKKRRHQQPGFNLDYSPPKTHPPSHN